MPSKTMPTASAPMAAMGWRTVVRGGVQRAEAATSSNPITEQCSGTRSPAAVRARMAPKAVMSSKARRAVKGRFCLMRSSVSFWPASKLESGSRESGRSTTRWESSSSPQVLGAVANAAPAGGTVAKSFGAADEGDFAMTEGMKMLEREIAADFVIDDDRTHGVAFELEADDRGGNAAFFKVGEQVDIEEEPVGENDETFDAAVEQHFQIALEAAALVVNVGEDGQVRRLVERVLNAAENQRAVGVGHVEDHDADGVAALAAQGAGELVGTVAEFFGGALDFFLGDGRDVAGERRVVQDNRDGGGRKTALLRHIANRNHGSVAFAVPQVRSSEAHSRA